MPSFINEEEFIAEYMQAMLEKAQELTDKISEYPFVKKCFLNGEGIDLTFNDSVDIKQQDILELFHSGGVIKKSSKSKDSTEEDFIKVESIGEY